MSLLTAPPRLNTRNNGSMLQEVTQQHDDEVIRVLRLELLRLERAGKDVRVRHLREAIQGHERRVTGGGDGP